MNNSFNKNININFSDGGSLDQLKTKYDQFGENLIQKSKNFSGGNTVQQNKFIKEEIQYYKELFEIQKKTFEEKKRQQEQIENTKESLRLKFKAGQISSGTYEAGLLEQDDKTKALLRGTGRRSWDRYVDSSEKTLSASESNVNRLEKLLDNVNINLRQILGQDKENALQTIKAINDDSNASPEQKLAALQAQQILDERNKPTQSKNQDLLKAFLDYKNIENLASGVRNTLGSQDGVSASRQAMELAKNSVVSVADLGIDLVSNFLGEGAGNTSRKKLKDGMKNIAKAGMRIGAEVFAAFMEEAFMAYEARQEFDKTNFGNTAVSGRRLKNFTMSSIGYSAQDVSGAYKDMMASAGTSSGVESQTRNALMLERGFGIDRSLSQSLLELTRTSKETDKNLTNIVGGIYESGQNIFKGDRAFLGEFISKNFSGLQRELLQNQSSVDTSTTMDILNRFNSLGGVWDAKNPNSMGNISSVNNALRNPQGDSMRAMAYTALRQKMPGATHTEIEMEMEKGLNSDIYLQSMLEQVQMMGGNEDFQVQNLKSLGLSTTAAYGLLKGKDNFSKRFKKGGLTSGLGSTIQSQAEALTTQQDRNMAELSDAKLQGDLSRISELISDMNDVIRESLSGATYTIDPVSKQLTLKTNVAKMPPKVGEQKSNSISNYQNRTPF